LREVSRHLLSSEIMDAEKGIMATIKLLEEPDASTKGRQRNDEEDIEERIEEVEERDGE